MIRNLIFTVFLLLAFISAHAETGIDIGIKGGIISSFEQPGLSLSSYNLDNLNMIGGQMHIATLPVVDLIVALDYSWRDEVYEIAGENLQFEARDFVVSASVVYPVSGLPVVRPYIGGGIASHALTYNYLRPVTLSLEDNDVTIPAASTEFGLHGLIGAKLAPAAEPFGVFLEARFNRVNTPGDAVTYNTWSAGIFYSLP
jgi:hypothetical protein